MDIKGISYTVGDAPADVLRRDMRAVAEDLHCTHVMLIGTDPEHHLAAARHALDAGLDVYIRPYLPDRRRAALLTHLTQVATAAERLRQDFPDRVTLMVGSEFSLTSPGMIPGPRLFFRLQILVRPNLRRRFDRRITRKVNQLLASAAMAARRSFNGPVTYAAGGWEQVDWTPFDIVGVNLYRLGTDKAAYEQRLKALLEASEKPVVITEFGCGAHKGADQRGPASFLIVNWLALPPKVKEGHVRDEQTQAAYLGELIELYSRHEVHGGFVFTFAMSDFPHQPDDPRHDLDMAGFGVVKFPPDAPTWQPKAAFHEVARRYGG
ncbi:hypothetical protein [Actinomadura rudentiformis]|uniref:Abortive infection protein n=1 Tax=Actinomadura rudentiformis TaxID=359158 RepID=A0A6H9YUL4_9ACTN|nr:hypothetical protein [Actinomadura rudentiformis]KAB2352297.1 hypothetical protein F8566_00935 [Actinomadura rudentiformis]